MKVTAVLVSHNGAAWLPAVLDGIRQATRAPDRIVAVDTGSSDTSATLVEQALGVHVLHADPHTPYAESVRIALEHAGHAEPDEWVWLLHDDSNPDPHCLAALAAAAEGADDDVAALGPKLREWPSLKRLLEVGVTLTGTGRRETWLERGEYDQGQHDEADQVLAVNTAGMLVRRHVLESVGLDRYLPVFGADLDFGWRVARAGARTLVVPDAVMFHVEASRNGRRSSVLVEHSGRQERVASQYTLLVNSPGWTIPFRSLRMVVGGLLRAIGLLLVRAPGEAADEVAALVDVFTHPGRIVLARRTRAGASGVTHAEMRHLLAPFWLPYRHGLDYVVDIGVAFGHVIEDAIRRRRAGHSPDASLTALVLRSTGLWSVVGVVVLAFVAERHLLTGGMLQGGALLPAPESVGHWWHTWAAGQHTLGTGSDQPGPAYLFPLALLGTLALGNSGMMLTAVFVLTVPACFGGALVFFRRVLRGSLTPWWGAAAYAVLPVVVGGVAQGRLGTVFGAVLLPWIGIAALGLRPQGGRDASPERARTRQWRSSWWLALGLGVLVAFVPPVMIVVLALALVLVVSGTAAGRLRQVVVCVAMPLLLVLPWAIGTLDSPGAWLTEAGRTVVTGIEPTFRDLISGRPGGVAAPWWIGTALPFAALVALLRPATRPRVLRAWLLVLAAAFALAAVLRVPVTLPGIGVDFHPWAGFLVLLMQAGFVLAIALAADGFVTDLTAAGFGWRQPLAVVAAVAAVAAPVLGAGWWLLRDDHGPVARDLPVGIPAYMQDLARGTDTSGVLVVEGNLRSGIDYRLWRSGPPRTGDDGVLALTEPDPDFRDLVERLVTSPGAGDAGVLASYGVKYVYAPGPVASVVSGGFDAANEIGGASAPARAARAWVVQHDPDLSALATDRADLRPLWIGLNVLAFVGCVVMAAPERRRRGIHPGVGDA